MTAFTIVLLLLLGGAAASGFLAILSFLRAGVWPDRAGPGRPARLELILGLDLDEAAHRHWRRAWGFTVAFMTLWAAAFVAGAIVLPLLQRG